MKRVTILLFMPFVFYVINSCKDKNNYVNEIYTIEYTDATVKKAYTDIVKAKKKNNISKLGGVYFELGYYYFGKNISDSAFYYFNQSKEVFLLKKDSTYIGRSLINMAVIQINEGDFYGSEETAVEALRYLKTSKDDKYTPIVYNNLAVSKVEQKNYIQAIEYYNQSLEFPTDKQTEISIKNNQAVAYIKSKNYINAMKILSTLVKDTVLYIAPKIQAKIIDNLAYAKWLNNPKYNAEIEFYQALRIREKENDMSGQIANHFHLVEYFTLTDIPNTIFHAKKMYEIASSSGTPDDQLEALRKLVLLENPVQAKKYFSIYLNLNDSLQTIRNDAKNQFALTRYEVEKNKKENLLLKTENAHKNYQILKQKVIVFSISFITIVSFVALVFWYRRRREKFKKEKREEVQRTELRYSKKIHDEVANRIYNLMIQIESNSNMEKEKTIDELEELYNKSRNISHESEFKIDLRNDFSNVLRELFQPYGANGTKIIVIGNENQLWAKITVEKRKEIYHVMTELMINMKKHSKASLVTLKFKEENNILNIEYSDNGVGVTAENWRLNKGLNNLKTRIISIQGELFFNLENKKGFSVKIIVNI